MFVIFLNELLNKNIRINLLKYKYDDLDTDNFLNEIINNKELFLAEFDGNKDIENLNINEFIKYLISLKLSKIKKDIKSYGDNINIEHMEYIDKISKYHDKHVGRGEVIKFINKEYIQIFELKKPTLVSIKKATIELILDNIKGISDDVFAFLANKYSYLLIDRYKDLFKKNSMDKFNLVYGIIFDQYLKKIKTSKDFVYSFSNDSLIDLCTYVSKKNTHKSIKDYANKVVDFEYNFAKKSIESVSIPYSHLSFLSKVRYLLFELRDDRFKYIDDIYLKLDEQIQKDLQQKGISIEFKLTEEEVLKIWNQNIGPLQKLISITHTGKYYPLIVPRDDKSKIKDIFSTNIETNDYFTITRQESLERIFSFLKGFIILLVSKKERQDEISFLISSATKTISIFLNDDDIYQYALMLIQNFSILKANEKEMEKNIYLKRTFLYNFGSLCCFMCDKMIKDLYIKAHSDSLSKIDESYITLGMCLRKEEESKYFDYDHIQSLRYFLLNDGIYKRIGHNLRNDFAHLNNKAKSSLSLENVAGAFFIFLDVLNTILIMSLDNNGD